MTPESTRKAFAELHDALCVLFDDVAKAFYLRQICDWLTVQLDRLTP